MNSENNELTAPMVLLDDTKQAKDIAESKGPSDTEAWARCKQYVKMDNIKWWRMNPRDWEFDQPFQVAAHYKGCTWAEGNLAFLGELKGCNLDCPWCFANNGDDAPTVDVTPHDYLAVYDRWCANHDPAPAVCRVSGGEPMLHQEWIGGLWEFLGESDYLWVDTNLTIHPSADIFCDPFGSFFSRHYRAAVCGCLKPGLYDLDEQLRVVETWLNDMRANLFLYWPTDSANQDQMVEVMDKLEEIAHGLPLRMLPIWIKQHYNVIPEDERIPEEKTRARWGMVKDRWWEYLWDNYTTAELINPSHLVPLEVD